MSERAIFFMRITVYGILSVLMAYALLAPLDARGQVPLEAQQWKRELTRQSRLEWGLDAPVATFGAQIQQESSWRTDARSPVGARGLAQFMPATAEWISGAYEALGPADPLNPIWAIRAMARYDRLLYDRVSAHDGCEQMAFALSQYNGGSKFFDRARAACEKDCDPSRWFGSVEYVDDGRSPGAWFENRDYVSKVLLEREPAYLAGGWFPGVCS